MYQPEKQKTPIPFEHVEKAAETNSDGMGLMFVRDRKVIIRKQETNVKGFYEKYLEAFTETSPVVLHFRIGTSGSTTIANCHPFYLNPDTAFCHNGVLGNGKDSKCDTRVFATEYLRQLPPNWMKNPVLLDLLANKISSDKMVFLDKTKHVVILNEKFGHWKDDIWYSNYSYKRYTYDTRSTYEGPWEYPYGRTKETLPPTSRTYSPWDDPNVYPPLNWKEKVWCWSCLPDFAWNKACKDKLYEIKDTNFAEVCNKCKRVMASSTKWEHSYA